MHSRPSADIEVGSFLGVNKTKIEVSPWFVLPQSMRTKIVTFDEELLPGRYKANLLLRDANNGALTMAGEFIFWFIPMWIYIGFALLILAIIFFVYRVNKIIKNV